MEKIIVETLTFHSKLTFERNYMASKSKEEIQKKLTEYSNKGYRLVSTNSINYGADLLVYLYFEKI